MKVTILKAFFKKQSRIISDRNYKNYNKFCFQEQLLDQLDKIYQNHRDLNTFQQNLSFSIKLLCSQGKRKQKNLATHVSFINGNLQQAIMV